LSAEHDVAVSFRFELTRIIRESLGLPEDVAVPLADHLARGLSRRMGGMYIGKRELARTVRDEGVRRDFTGRNRAEVMDRYRISMRTFYRIIQGPRGNCQNGEKWQ